MRAHAKTAGRLLKRAADSEILWWFISVGGLLLLWELLALAGLGNPTLFPPPHTFLALFFESGQFQGLRGGVWSMGWLGNLALPIAIAATFLRIFVGLSIGFVIGCTIGLLTHYSRWFGYLARPILRLFAGISAVAWISCAIMILRSGERVSVALVALSIVFILALSVSETISAVPKRVIDAAKVLGASRRQIFTTVIVPYSLPRLYRLMRLNFFGAWAAVLLAEMFDVSVGLGILILLAQTYVNTTLAYFLIVLIGVCGFIWDAGLRYIERRVFWYYYASTSGRSSGVV